MGFGMEVERDLELTIEIRSEATVINSAMTVDNSAMTVRNSAKAIVNRRLYIL